MASTAKSSDWRCAELITSAQRPQKITAAQPQVQPQSSMIVSAEISAADFRRRELHFAPADGQLSAPPAEKLVQAMRGKAFQSAAAGRAGTRRAAPPPAAGEPQAAAGRRAGAAGCAPSCAAARSSTQHLYPWGSSRCLRRRLLNSC